MIIPDCPYLVPVWFVFAVFGVFSPPCPCFVSVLSLLDLSRFYFCFFRDHQGQSLSVPVCPCLSPYIFVCHSLSLYVPVCPCLSLSVLVCPCLSLSVCPVPVCPGPFLPVNACPCISKPFPATPWLSLSCPCPCHV